MANGQSLVKGGKDTESRPGAINVNQVNPRIVRVLNNFKLNYAVAIQSAIRKPTLASPDSAPKESENLDALFYQPASREEEERLHNIYKNVAKEMFRERYG